MEFQADPGGQQAQSWGATVGVVVVDVIIIDELTQIAYVVRLVPLDPDVAKYSSFVAVCVQKAFVIESPVYIGRLTQAYEPPPSLFEYPPPMSFWPASQLTASPAAVHFLTVTFLRDESPVEVRQRAYAVIVLPDDPDRHAQPFCIAVGPFAPRGSSPIEIG
jgi:hypothetical protein